MAVMGTGDCCAERLTEDDKEHPGRNPGQRLRIAGRCVRYLHGGPGGHRSDDGYAMLREAERRADSDPQHECDPVGTTRRESRLGADGHLGLGHDSGRTLGRKHMS
jgi:hypothetical protein